MWTKEHIADHREAAKRLLKIKDQIFAYIEKNKNITELEAQVFLYEKFKEAELKTDKTPLIVAFSSSSADPHYHPSSLRNRMIRNGSIMIDIWGRLNKKNAPFADITWMGYRGESVPQKMQKIFDIVIGARDEGIKFIKKKLKKGEMPLGKEVDKAVRDHINGRGYGEKFIHGTGHSLGFLGPHGNKSRISRKGQKHLRFGTAYTIEPGIYLPNQFGVRSEIDFYVDNNFRLIITTEVQKKIIKIK